MHKKTWHGFYFNIYQYKNFEKYILISFIFSLSVKMNYINFVKYNFMVLFFVFSIMFILSNNSYKTFAQLDTNNFHYQYYLDEENIHIPDQFIIYLKDNSNNNFNTLDPEEFYETELKNTGTELLYTYNYVTKGLAIKIPDENVLEILKRNPNVEYIGQDMIVSIFSNQKVFTQINHQELPMGIDRVDGDLSPTRNNINSINADIAVLDTGIDLDHEDLNVYQQISFIPNTNSADDDHGHGTHIAGIAAAKNNELGTVGIAPGARLWAVKVLEETGIGDMSTLVKGLDYVAENADQIDVAVLSLGCECKSNALDIAVNNVVNLGVTLVVAAGNDGTNAETFSPANNPNVITVSAIVDTDGKCGGNGQSTSYGQDDTLATFSNYGDIVDISAPGVEIFSTYKSNSYTSLSGTSMAAPHVAGAAALYKSIHQDATPSEIKNHLVNSGTELSDFCDGNGHGYFSADKDNFNEPLLYLGKD